MSPSSDQMTSEMDTLFGALCDGLRQEVRARRIVALASKQDKEELSLTAEREAGIASVLAFHLRGVGFFVQVESYIKGNQMRRPDFRIWLPQSTKHLYLELKIVGWGDAYRSYSYAGTHSDIKKLSGDQGLSGEPHGLLVVGFGKTTDSDQQLFKGCQKLSKWITQGYPSYKPIGPKVINLRGLDSKTSYAVVGLWVSMGTQSSRS